MSPHFTRKARGIVNCQQPIHERSITLSLSITCRTSPGVNQERLAGFDRSHYLTTSPAHRLRPSRTLLCPLSVCRAPRPATSPPILPTPRAAKPCHHKQPTTQSRLRHLASDDASASRAMPVAYASPGMSWARPHSSEQHVLRNPHADECPMCQMRWSAAKVLVLSIADIGMPI